MCYTATVVRKHVNLTQVGVVVAVGKAMLKCSALGLLYNTITRVNPDHIWISFIVLGIPYAIC